MIIGALITVTTTLSGVTAASAAPITPPITKQGGQSLNAYPEGYNIRFRTANFPDAGTDATIAIKVYGTLRDSPGYVNLDTAHNDFERGHVDYFGTFTWFDIGTPDFIGVHKHADGSDWFPEFADINVASTNIWYHCQMDANYGSGDSTQWFDCLDPTEPQTLG